MEYTRLGSTGLEVSRICLGCMSYGESTAGFHPWVLDEATAQPFFEQAVEAGINFFDSANVYSAGTSEEFLGRALKRLTTRDDVVIATKVHGRMRKGPNGGGLSRKAILSEVDHSLRRLDVDYIDLYQIHRFDPITPVEETMEALHDTVRAGKVRYLGASSMWAWQFAKMQHAAERNGWTTFVSMQDHYNLLNREEEREMHPLCVDQGVGVIPWSPLARGRLTRPYGEQTVRSEGDPFGNTLYSEASNERIIDAVGAIAETRGISRAQVALAWVLSKPAVTAPIVGATKTTHLSEAIAALEVVLAEEEIASLEEHYTPRTISGAFS